MQFLITLDGTKLPAGVTLQAVINALEPLEGSDYADAVSVRPVEA